MKTVGIITMHRPDNYGSYLQTFATYNFISSLGYDTKVIDYAYPTTYHKALAAKRNPVSRAVRKSFIHRKLSGLFRRLLHIDTRKHSDKMRNFYHRNVKFTMAYSSEKELCKNPPIFDIYVTGSDQVWNPELTGKDASYLLSWVPEGKTKIAYAASFAIRHLPHKVETMYAEELKAYHAIGIREQSEILNKLGIDNGKVVLDPTFLYDKSKWLDIVGEHSIIKGKYILCYLLSYNFNPYPYAYKVINHLHRQTGFKVVMVDGDPANVLRGYHIAGNLGPEDFINLFAHASYVVTNSFHGTAFAANFEKPFITIVNNTETNDNRQLSLIDMLEISPSRALKFDDDLKDVKPIYNIEWLDKLQECRISSINYLRQALQQA